MLMTNRVLTILLAVLSIALVALVAVWLVGDADSSSSEPEVVAAAQVPEFVSDQSTAVYWLGERPNAEYELTESPSGRVYVRYLTGDAEAGDPRADFITVGTYPSDNGIAELRRAAQQQEGAELGRTDDGAVLLIDPNSPNNAHLAYPDEKVQIEVYSPIPGQALRLAEGGAVEPVS